MTALVGWLVIVIDIGQFVPQAYRTVGLHLQRHSLRGLSLWTWSVASVQAALWVVYGLETDRLPIALPNLLIAPVCLLIVALAALARRRDITPMANQA